VRRHRGWVVAAVGALLVLVATAMIGGRDKSGETVSAGEWAQSVCGAVGVWRGQIEDTVDMIRDPNSSAPGGSEPQSETPQGRTGFIRKGLERSVDSTETLVDAINDAGTPDTADGEAAAQLVSDWAEKSLDTLEKAQDDLDREAATIDEALVQIGDAAGAIAKTITSGRETIAAVARTDPEVGSALRDSSTCRQLREDEAR